MTLNKYIAISLCIIPFSCGLSLTQIGFNDKELKPYWIAIEKVDRKTFGFSDIEKDSKIRLEDDPLIEESYYRLLHIYGLTSRTITLELLDNGDLKWIGEKEIFSGPLKYETIGGEFNEQLILTYELKPISGNKINSLNITYQGERPELINNSNLTLEIVSSYIENWKKSNAQQLI